MFLPKSVYEALPWLYGIAGIASLAVLRRACGGSGYAAGAAVDEHGRDLLRGGGAGGAGHGKCARWLTAPTMNAELMEPATIPLNASSSFFRHVR